MRFQTLHVAAQFRFRNTVPGLVGLLLARKYIDAQQVGFAIVGARQEIRFQI
ncbi:hypothetical protein D3C86_1552010 [compost metagenome]